MSEGCSLGAGRARGCFRLRACAILASESLRAILVRECTRSLPAHPLSQPLHTLSSNLPSPPPLSPPRRADLLKLADVLSTCLVLVPLILSISSLKATLSTEGDGRSAGQMGDDNKTRSTLVRLEQFRSFYMVTVRRLSCQCGVACVRVGVG